MPADLHVHSNLSDGTHTPEELVELAKEAGLTAIALTDHDGVGGIERAQNKGAAIGLEVVAGIEFTTEVPKAEVHILGYFIDFKSPKLLETIKNIQEDRVNRIYRIVEKLKALGVEITPQDVFEISGKAAPGRPHVARALIKKGIVPDFRSAFYKYLDFRAPAYVSHYKLTPGEAVKLIKEIKGIPVFAHPQISACDDLIPDLLADGLKGIEVYYPGYGPGTIAHYKQLAKKYGLLLTGGSDYHGLDSGREVRLGDITLSDGLFKKLKDEHLRGN